MIKYIYALKVAAGAYAVGAVLGVLVGRLMRKSTNEHVHNHSDH